VKLLKPLTDAIARLEKLSASLDQIFIAIITCYREVQQTDIELEYQSWKVAVLTAISSLAKRLNHPAYFVALFLNPGWQTMAISQKYNIESITKEILILAKRFGFPKSQCIEIKSDVTDYIVLAQARGNWDGIDLWRWWNQQLRCQQLRLFALKLLSVRQHRSRREDFFVLKLYENQVSKPVGCRENENDGSDPKPHPSSIARGEKATCSSIISLEQEGPGIKRSRTRGRNGRSG
jgi:hypothetical protein